jgi:hypothetical protein
MDRQVKRAGKDTRRNIITLCNAGESWSPRNAADAIDDIENGLHTYYVREVVPRVSVIVVNEGGSKYLRTAADKTSKNNLDNLQDC